MNFGLFQQMVQKRNYFLTDFDERGQKMFVKDQRIKSLSKIGAIFMVTLKKT